MVIILMIVKIVIVVKKYGSVLIVEKNLIQKNVLYFMKIDIVEKKTKLHQNNLEKQLLNLIFFLYLY